MKFSILLPTRNRLDLLAYAVESVRRQDYQDWEIIISDNDSEVDVKGYAEALDDHRILYFRTDEFVSVTANWNNALHHATGDYFIMLGDDDGLMPNALSSIAGQLSSENNPEAIYVDAWQYAYPGVVPQHPSAFIQRGYTKFLEEKRGKDSFYLRKAEAEALVDASLSFRITFGFNMQHYFISMDYVARIKDYGEFFQSPYPDYYAANMLMLLADPVLVVREPLVVIGISPKSFGFYYSNKQETAGDAFLKLDYTEGIRGHLASVLLPGSSLLDSWLYAMETLKTNLAGTHQLSLDYKRYRLLQVYMSYAAAGWQGVRILLPYLTIAEKLQCAFLAAYLGLTKSICSTASRHKALGKWSPWPVFDASRFDVGAENILEAIAALTLKPGR